MEYEIELKLLTNKQAGEIIEKKLLTQLDATVTKEAQVLTNHYFDTPNRMLRQHNIGLRIRGNNLKFEQTLKTAGKSIGGLHQRPEYNVQLDESVKQNVDVPELRLFPLSAWPKTIDVDALQAKIETLFTTHFERRIYLLKFSNGDIVELVWDVGEVTSGKKSVPICEIELELKKGSTAVLFNLAKRIVNLLPTTIGTDSKAALGYNLRDGLTAKKFAQYQQNLPENTQNEAAGYVSLLTTLLQEFQMLSAEIRRHYSVELATTIKQTLIALVDNFDKFDHHFPCSPLDSVHLRLKVLNDDWSLVTQQSDTHTIHNLLVSAQTTQLQLDIVQCLVEQPWSSDI
ncbi:MAG: triphosphatase [Paraglaciecola sp.]|jgi:triphosphatase